MSSNVDYVTIALITIFTSFFAGLGKELADFLIDRLKNGHKRLKEKNGNGDHKP
jgi:hypothetical protein